jgi:hypothetical protein
MGRATSTTNRLFVGAVVISTVLLLVYAAMVWVDDPTDQQQGGVPGYIQFDAARGDMSSPFAPALDAAANKGSSSGAAHSAGSRGANSASMAEGVTVHQLAELDGCPPKWVVAYSMYGGSNAR